MSDSMFDTSGREKVIEVTPVLDTSQYASGDVLAPIFEIPGFTATRNGCGALAGFSVIDLIQQKPALRLWFFSKKITAPAANAAWTLSDADAKYFQGYVDTSTYVDIASVNSYYDVDLTKSKIMRPFGYTKSIWCVPVLTSGTPTYTDVNQLILHFRVIPLS